MTPDEQRAYREGEVKPPCPELVFSDHNEAHTLAGEFCKGWRKRYPTQPPLWVVQVPGGYAIVPNDLYYPNMAWKDAQDWIEAAKEYSE
jgi:hypothetical protein